MAIAKVRIAPKEQWCDISDRLNFGCGNEQGVEIEIRTETMHVSPNCGGKRWIVSPESRAKLFEAIGRPDHAPTREMTICEHMLEMD